LFYLILKNYIKLSNNKIIKMEWFDEQVYKSKDKEIKSFEYEQLEKIEVDYDFIKEQGYDNLHDFDSDENHSFIKITFISIIFIITIAFILFLKL